MNDVRKMMEEKREQERQERLRKYQEGILKLLEKGKREEVRQ